MDGQETSHPRPATPESPMTSSFYHASSTIDELTLALANFSRVPSPELPSILTCCCRKEDCENLTSWLTMKSRLESRLTLSAEVGQALLQRHEAYVRQHEDKPRQKPPRAASIQRVAGGDRQPPSSSNILEDIDAQISELIQDKTVLEKRLNQALVNNEVTEVSNKTILHELQEARTTISRLTAHHARSVGWDTRLAAALKERDDMQQERDSETSRARLAESRFAALRDKTAKLQAEVRRLQVSLEEKRQHRLESSESLLQDARVRLESIYKSHAGITVMTEENELTKVLESLVEDNENLKRDNAELQQLLTDSREDLHALQEEVDEQRANVSSRSGANTPHTPLSRHFHTGSVPSISLKDFSAFGRSRRSSSAERKRRTLEPLTPETSGRPLSPTDSLSPSDARWTSFRHSQPRYPSTSSHVSYEIEEDASQEIDAEESEKPRGHKPLLLLNRSRGVQTEPWPGLLSPSPMLSHISTPSNDPRSESSSFSESLSSYLSALLERAVALHNRMAQADALTLTNRLKRQHLKGADVGHLSRSTVSNIINEANNLRNQFRALLEDDKIVVACTRKDLRVLLKFFKDVFTEMGQLRVTLNDVILDPTNAPRISELALNPAKAEADMDRENASLGVGGGWMAPISKLFAPSARTENSAGERNLLNRSTSGPVRAPRFVPKLRPALAASATTVNVEFSGTGVGRSMTSTFSASASQPEITQEVSLMPQSNSAMSIFAGAPQPAPADSWVVLPKGPRKVQSTIWSPSETATPAATATIGRSAGRRNNNRLSRNVDAVIDVERPIDEDEEPDFLPPLLERTLRRRGLSDSSIHSTFTNQGDDARVPPSQNGFSGESEQRRTIWPERGSVFQALSRTVQNFRIAASHPSTSAASQPVSSPPSSSVPQLLPQTPRRIVSSTPRKAASGPVRVASPGITNILPNLSSWATSNMMANSPEGADPFIAGSSIRDESFVQRTRRPGEDGRDFF
ncbi:hypothetical protein BDQ12DRAFT_643723 [Crucibulum laeve]|uniref:Uncharacterized protein n=1 Tax=Crucibulum laeve TaxID=68775 RepID=A0A5C3MHU6_9AGAR|nr:hypothetical protein BDQ12DRAFT_643723 [Crucibulum laeve]